MIMIVVFRRRRRTSWSPEIGWCRRWYQELAEGTRRALKLTGGSVVLRMVVVLGMLVVLMPGRACRAVPIGLGTGAARVDQQEQQRQPLQQ